MNYIRPEGQTVIINTLQKSKLINAIIYLVYFLLYMHFIRIFTIQIVLVQKCYDQLIASHIKRNLIIGGNHDNKR